MFYWRTPLMGGGGALSVFEAVFASCSEVLGFAADVGVLPGWWFKPEYIINELNINAAITSPAHDEVVALRPQPYTVRGYAYTGAPGTGVTVLACQG